MIKLRVLTSVSVVALATAAGISGAKANNLLVDLTALPPTIAIAAGSTASGIANEDGNINSSVTAFAGNIVIGYPLVTGSSHDVGGGVDSIAVDQENAVFAVAIGAQGISDIDFYTADNGLTPSDVGDDTSAATANSLLFNINTNVTAEVDNVDIQADVLDLGTGSSVTVSDNSLRASGIGNDADVSVNGSVNPFQNSTEFGQADITTGAPPSLSAGATALSGNAQINISDVPVEMSALVSDSRIGLLARVNDDTTEIAGVPLDIVGNTIAASFVGNNAATEVDLDAEGAITLIGTAGAANVQINDGDFSIVAEVRDVTIEAGDTVAYAGDEYISDLVGSDLTLTDNEVSATATSNSASNSVKLAEGLSQDGVAGLADQFNTIDLGATDSASVNGDLFIANAQYSSVPVVAEVELLNRASTINVLTDDVAGSTIDADDNSVTAAATGSAVVNSLEVGNATNFDSLVGINSIQYTEGSQTATNESLIRIDIASNDDVGTEGVVTDSSISVDGSELSAEATGNSHSSSIDIKGTTVTGPSDDDTDLIDIDRSATLGFINADWSLFNVQVLDNGSAVAVLTTGIDVDVADIQFTTADLSVSENDIHGQAIGNLSTEASISIDAVSITGSIGVVNSQTVEDNSLLSSEIIASNGAFIDVDVAAGNAALDPITVDEAAIHVDDNSFNSRVWGNLADSTTNSINVKGVTVSDAGIPFTDIFVDRTAPVTYTELNGGFGLLNDQSVEDLNTAVVNATATGDLINITVGDDANGDSSVTNSDITADGNEALTTATLNQATSSITIDAVTNSAGAALANVQTLTDQDGTEGSAAMLVDQTDLDITIDVIAGDEALSELNVSASENNYLAAARINLATNSLKVNTQTQIVDDVVASGINQISVELDGPTPFTRGGNVLLNDQAFLSLNNDGVVVNINDNDITIDLSVDDDDIENSTAHVNLNAINALAAGNDATNTLEVNAGVFDTADADVDGSPTNGPIANLVSNQWGFAGGEDGGFSTNIIDTTIAIDANANDTTDVEGSDLSADENTVRALSRANNVVNTLSSKGTVLEAQAPDSPGAFVDVDGRITYNETQFGLASRQVNSVDIASTVEDTAISVEVGSPFGGNGAIDDDIFGSSLTANSNLVVSEARGSDGANLLALNFTQNEGQAFVTNLQYADNDVTYEASTTGTEITVLSNVGGELIDSALSASGNAVASLASANRATNVLNSLGTNVVMTTSNNVVTYDPTATANVPAVGSDAPLVVDSHLAVINVQGNPGDDGANNSDVHAETLGTLIGVISEGLVESGSITADDNLVLSQATQHNASNTLNITAEANIASASVADSTPGASVVSLQTIFDGDETTAAVAFTGIIAYGEDPRSGGSFAASASDNQIIASAIGATAINTLRATAGASIDLGAGGSSPITGGTDPTIQVNADFNVLNIQTAEGALVEADVFGALIFAGAAEDYNNDAIEVSDNLVRAEARGLVSQNLLALDAGAASDAFATVANVQQIEGGTFDADVEGVAILTGNLDEGAINSSLTVDGNSVEALASGNRAVNQLITSAGATLQESSGAGATVDPAGVSRLIVTGADYSILNDQSTDGAAINASVEFVGITVDGLNAVTGVDNSAIGVEGNQIVASAVGNEAVNQLVLNTGTFQHPSAAIANIQTNSGTSVTATVDGAVIGIGALATLDANSSNSSFKVRGNSVTATAIGNSSINIISSGE